MTAEPPRRPALTREGVLRAAIALADEAGDGVPSMRALAKRLGVEAMSLYHHFRTKELILDGMIDIVFGEIELPDDADWRTALRGRACSMRAALTRHPWALGLMDSRANPGLATVRHLDAVLGRLRTAGFTVAGAAHAISVLDSYVYGFAMQEHSLPFTGPSDVGEVAGPILDRLPRDEFPHLAEMIVERAMTPGYAYFDEFDIGLTLILDALEHHRGKWA